jgi:hypothetical protein
MILPRAIVVASALVAASAAHGQLAITVNPNSTTRIAITSVTGTGSASDPIIINENWFGTDLDSTINIAGALSQRQNGVNPAALTIFEWGIYVSKRVTNNSGTAWTFFDHELQVTLGTPSVNGDRLSFAQNNLSARPWTSDLLPTVVEIIDPRDYINFSGGTVLPGQTVTFNYVITYRTPQEDLFFLRQRPNFIPAPGAAGLLAMSGLIAVRRRR